MLRIEDQNMGAWEGTWFKLVLVGYQFLNIYFKSLWSMYCYEANIALSTNAIQCKLITFLHVQG
jgi:hypothetical protein